MSSLIWVALAAASAGTGADSKAWLPGRLRKPDSDAFRNERHAFRFRIEARREAGTQIVSGTIETCAAKARAIEISALNGGWATEIVPAEIRVIEHGSCEIGLLEISAKIRPGEVRLSKRRLISSCPVQVGTSEVGAVELGSVAIDPLHDRT